MTATSQEPDNRALATPLLDKPSRLPPPAEIAPPRVRLLYAIGITSLHVLALLACLPWLFSWTGLALCVAGHFIYGMLGICVGYHRLLTHRSFTCPKWLERTFATLGCCCLQDSPQRWVAIHRKHHQYSDDQPDPHSPLVDFFWGHIGWLFVQNHEQNSPEYYRRYVPDLLRDPYYCWLERHRWWAHLYIVHAALYFLAGYVIDWSTTRDWMAGVQFGASLLVWGVFVRTVVVYHITWAVNSVTHVWGYRNYETNDNSRNNWVVALLAHGEGWHNNHHQDQRSARHGHRWWEFDMTWWVIRLLELAGLAKDVVRPHRANADELL